MTWLGKHIQYTLVLLVLSVLIVEFTGLDLRIQDQLYDFATGQWMLSRDEPISRLLFYDGMRTIYILAVLGLTGTLLLLRKLPRLQASRKGLWIVWLSMLIIPLTVNVLKASSDIPCPRDLVRYGGDYPHVTILSGYPADFSGEPNVECYPAGHASGGFALLSLFFLFSRKRARRVAVASVLVLSWTVGNYKMLIGDHFFSHTLVTMLLSWLLILLIVFLIQPQYKPDETT